MTEPSVPGEASRQSRQVELASQEHPEKRGPRWSGSLVHDVRFAVRTLLKNSGFAITAILTLALGIGANTAIFQLVDAVLLRSLPVVEPQRLATIQIKGGNGGFGINLGDTQTTLSYPLWEEILRHQEPFSEVFAWANSGSTTLGEGAQQRRARGLWVSGETFSALGLHPFKGRTFRP